MQNMKNFRVIMKLMFCSFKSNRPVVKFTLTRTMLSELATLNAAKDTRIACKSNIVSILQLTDSSDFSLCMYFPVFDGTETEGSEPKLLL